MRNSFIFCIIIVIGLLSLILYYNTNISYEITSEVARKKIKQGKYDYIVDVRTKEEWNEHHLENIINIPIGNLVSELPKRIPDKDARILFVCKKGIRAGGVVVIAHKLGYNNVEAMRGNYKELLE